MPYDPNDRSTLPENTRGYNDKEARQFSHIFNSMMAKHGDETRAFKAAYGVVGKWKKEKGFSPDDPDRDILIEFEVSELMDKEDMGFPDIGISQKDIDELMLSSKVGADVELEE